MQVYSGSSMESISISQQQKHSENSQQRWNKPRKQSKYIRGERKGKWSDQQHLKYIVFIDFHKKKMRSKQRRRSDKFYKAMATFIETRNSLQCRSHHQKLEQRYKYPNKIVTSYKQLYDKNHYKDLFEDLSRRTQTTVNNDDNIFIEVATKTTMNVEVQTDLSGVHLNLMFVPPTNIVPSTMQVPSNIIPRTMQVPSNIISSTMQVPSNDNYPMLYYHQPRLYW